MRSHLQLGPHAETQVSMKSKNTRGNPIRPPHDTSRSKEQGISYKC